MARLSCSAWNSFGSRIDGADPGLLKARVPLATVSNIIPSFHKGFDTPQTPCKHSPAAWRLDPTRHDVSILPWTPLATLDMRLHSCRARCLGLFAVPLGVSGQGGACNEGVLTTTRALLPEHGNRTDTFPAALFHRDAQLPRVVRASGKQRPWIGGAACMHACRGTRFVTASVTFLCGRSAPGDACLSLTWSACKLMRTRYSGMRPAEMISPP